MSDALAVIDAALPPAAPCCARVRWRVWLRVWVGSRALIGVAARVLAAAGVRAESVRARDAASCLPGAASTWSEGQDRAAAAAGALRLVYRHAGAPPGLDEVQVLGAVQRALATWSGCGVPTEVFLARLPPG